MLLSSPSQPSNPASPLRHMRDLNLVPLPHDTVQGPKPFQVDQDGQAWKICNKTRIKKAWLSAWYTQRKLDMLRLAEYLLLHIRVT